MNWNQRDSEVEIEHLKKRIEAMKHSRDEFFDETEKLQAEIERLKKDIECRQTERDYLKNKIKLLRAAL